MIIIKDITAVISMSFYVFLYTYKTNSGSCFRFPAFSSLTGPLQFSVTCPFSSKSSLSITAPGFWNRILSFSNFAASRCSLDSLFATDLLPSFIDQEDCEYAYGHELKRLYAKITPGVALFSSIFTLSIIK